jgi:hypothetical protein
MKRICQGNVRRVIGGDLNLENAADIALRLITQRSVDPSQNVLRSPISWLAIVEAGEAMGGFFTPLRLVWKSLPQLVRFLLLHAAIGIGAGWLLLVLLLWTDVNGVATLIWASDSPALPVAMLAAGFAITFGGAAAAAAVMMIRFENDGD